MRYLFDVCDVAIDVKILFGVEEFIPTIFLRSEEDHVIVMRSSCYRHVIVIHPLSLSRFKGQKTTMLAVLAAFVQCW